MLKFLEKSITLFRDPTSIFRKIFVYFHNCHVVKYFSQQNHLWLLDDTLLQISFMLIKPNRGSKINSFPKSTVIALSFIVNSLKARISLESQMAPSEASGLFCFRGAMQQRCRISKYQKSWTVISCSCETHHSYIFILLLLSIKTVNQNFKKALQKRMFDFWRNEVYNSFHILHLRKYNRKRNKKRLFYLSLLPPQSLLPARFVFMVWL